MPHLLMRWKRALAGDGCLLQDSIPILPGFPVSSITKMPLDATMYDDIQELLSASDAIISDYSSVIFDFALTGRPCFQYAADIDAYRRDRNFYIPLDKLPFPLSVTPDELCESIRNFNDGAFAEKWKSFAGQYGIIEDGQASRRCADWILEKIK
jgi:CDP-glycerol glycerophosphotransferase (TagB/SpsB family)